MFCPGKLDPEPMYAAELLGIMWCLQDLLFLRSLSSTLSGHEGLVSPVSPSNRGWDDVHTGMDFVTILVH